LAERAVRVRCAAVQLDHYQELEKSLQDAALVCATPEFAALQDDISAAWLRLRTRRETFAKVQTACPGAMPNDVARSMAHEPLEQHVACPVDTAFVESWQIALAGLWANPENELPTRDRALYR